MGDMEKILDKIVKEGNEDFERFQSLQALVDAGQEEIRCDPYFVIAGLMKRNVDLQRKLKKIKDSIFHLRVRPDDSLHYRVYRVSEDDYNALIKIKKIFREE